jgi:biopolymer transport protein ExbB
MTFFQELATIFLVFFSVAAHAEDELMKAYQREYAFLLAQRDALTREQTQGAQQQKERIQRQENEVRILEKQLALQTAENDNLFTEIQEFEKKKKDQQARDNSLLSTYKKAAKFLNDMEMELQLSAGERIDPVIPQNVSVLDFRDIQMKGLNYLQKATSIENIRASYKTAQGELVEGPVLRFGRTAAHAVDGQSLKVLGPDGDGQFKELEQTSVSAAMLPFYLFESIFDKAIIKKQSSIWDRLADFMPLVILGFVMLLVGSLFVMFARE